jgi:hypothetical protein
LLGCGLRREERREGRKGRREHGKDELLRKNALDSVDCWCRLLRKR